MFKMKKKSIKISALLFFGLLFLSNVYGVIGAIPSESSEETNSSAEELIDTEVPIYDDNTNVVAGLEPIDFTGEEFSEPVNYDRDAIEWRPIEESLRNYEFNSEVAGASIATASYNVATGVETIKDPQFFPSAEVMPDLSFVEPYAGLLAGENGAEAVIGADDRLWRTDNDVYPWRTVVKIYTSAADGTNWIGSGAMIDNYHVLTAGHVAFLPDNGGWASQLEIVPGMDTSDTPPDPYGHAYATLMRSYTGWTVSESSQHDWAVITLDRNVGMYTGWMGRTTAGSSSSIYSGTMNVAGYPGDLFGGNRMYWDADAGDGATSNNHYYWADTAGGMSGGPVWRYVSGSRYIMSVHAYGRGGTDSNFGTRLNNDKYDRIFTWLGADSAPTDKADLVDRGSAYDLITSGTWTASVTTVTLTNGIRNVGTASSGTYNVHYYASTNDYISTFDYYIGTSTSESTGAFGTDSATFTGTLPANIPAGVYYIGWIIDNDDTVDEFDETNNRAVYASQRTILGAPPPSGYIEVTVRDSVTSSLISSAFVSVKDNTDTVIDTGWTDGSGFYNITGLDIGWHTIDVSKVGYYDQQKVDYINWDGDDDYLTFYMVEMPPDSSYIEVIVRDSVTSSLIPSAYVQVTNMSSGLVIDTGYTNGAGFYNATGLFIGWYEISVSKTGYKDQTKQNYINWNGDDDYLWFYLDKMPINSGYIEVRTYNETGGVLSGVLVRAWNNSGATLVSQGFTNINGTYNITGLVIGWYEVNVTYLAYQEQSKSDYINWNGDDDYLSFWMVPNPPDSGYIEVNVYDSASFLPISWATIEVTNQSSGLLIQTGFTDPSGFYKVVNLTIGWYTVEIKKVGYQSQSKQTYINWAGDDDYLTFYMVELPPDSGYIEVTVKDDDTLAPIQNVLVTTYYSNGTYFSSGWTDSLGFYNVTGLYIGWYEVVVTHSNYGGDSIMDYINWNGDDDYLNFYLVIKPPGWIEVSVYDSRSYIPISNALVRCYNTTSGELFDSGYTDVNGFYNITDLLIGWWTVNVSLPGYDLLSQFDYINWRGDDDYLTFYLAMNVPVFSGTVAIFRDRLPWNLNMTEPVLVNYGIPYTLYNSSDFGSVDLSSFDKVIIPSDQTQTFYNRLSGNSSWFESYVSNGGFLDLRLTDRGWASSNWDGLVMPGGLNKTWVYLEDVSINLPLHPILNNPFLVEDVELDGWLYSAHGYFHQYPTDAKKILLYPAANEPVMLEFMYGSGFIVATMQTIEWNENKNLTRILENMILYNPGDGFASINVTSPINTDSWDISTTHTITWDATGTFPNVKIDLYENGVFVMELAASTPNDGSYSWDVPIGLSNSTLYQIKVSDVDYPATTDFSDNFEIEDLRSLTVVVPDSTTTWALGDIQDITWTSTGSIANVKIELYENGGLLLVLAASTSNDGSFSWTIPISLSESLLYQIRVSDALDTAMEDYSENFEIEDTRSITVVVPDSSSSWIFENTYDISWTSTGPIANVKIELYASLILVMVITASTSNDGLYSWLVPNTLVNSTEYIIRISDVLYPIIYDDSDTFTISGPSSAIPGYDLLILSSLLVGVSIYLIIRKRKKLSIPDS